MNSNSVSSGPSAIPDFAPLHDAFDMTPTPSEADAMSVRATVSRVSYWRTKMLGTFSSYTWRQKKNTTSVSEVDNFLPSLPPPRSPVPLPLVWVSENTINHFVVVWSHFIREQCLSKLVDFGGITLLVASVSSRLIKNNGHWIECVSPEKDRMSKVVTCSIFSLPGR